MLKKLMVLTGFTLLPALMLVAQGSQEFDGSVSGDDASGTERPSGGDFYQSQKSAELNSENSGGSQFPSDEMLEQKAGRSAADVGSDYFDDEE